MRIGLIGVSHWHAAMHAAAIRAAGAEVVAVWDADPNLAGRFADGLGAPAVSTPSDAIAASDLVVVMGRPDTTPALAEIALAARRPMILEKPAATGARGLAELATRAVATEAFVAVPLPNRLGPIMLEHARLAALGRAGTIAHAHFRLVNGPPERYRADGVAWMLDPAISGGGALRNLGIHGVDSALALATGELRLVSARIGNRIHDAPVEDYALLVLEDEAGAVFTVETGYTFASMEPGGDFEWRIATANAYLIDSGDAAFAATLDDGARHDLVPLPPSLRYNRFMADTLSRLGRGAPPAVGLDDYVRAMRLIDHAYAEATR
ncbi:MAG: Gfo/Idh/MocA family oxidoreductase [Devosia sp.]